MTQGGIYSADLLARRTVMDITRTATIEVLYLGMDFCVVGTSAFSAGEALLKYG